MKKIVFAVGAITCLGLIGCATPPRDVSRLQSTIAKAESGDFGACVDALYRTGNELNTAKQTLARSSRHDFRDEDYDAGLRAARLAVQYRREAEQACYQRLAVVTDRVQELETTREVLRGVTFTVNSAQLTPQAKTVLDVVANKLIRQPEKVVIAGHTSSTGSPEHNMQLSQQRAESVRNYLVKRGVPRENLRAKGFGMTQPVASNNTQQGRNANKRVELHYVNR